VSTVLFGATTTEQVADNVQALALLGRLNDAEFKELRDLAPR
jgi:aryl-alcohol dehydrogenase-like predicted oxidoreductase